MLPYEFDFYHKNWPDQIYHADPIDCGARQIKWISSLNGKERSVCYEETHIQELIEDGTWIMINSVQMTEDDCISDVSTIL